MASKEEPAWKAELDATIYRYFDQIGGGSIEFLTERFGVALAPHIHAAEQRGFQAGVNKTGDSVGKLRAKLKAARDYTYRWSSEDDREPLDRECLSGVVGKILELLDAPDKP